MAQFVASIIGMGDEMTYRRIRELREDKDWTQQHVADLLHMNRRTYGSYENGKRMFPPEVLAQLARLHGVSADYLLELTDDPAPREPRLGPVRG